MAISETKQRELIRITHEIAWAMVEDLAHMRDVVSNKKVTSGELRRMSNQLRRLLIDNDGDLRKVAAPRLAKRLHISNFNSNLFIEERGKDQLSFVSLGFSGIFGVQQEAIIVTGKTTYIDPDITYLDPWNRQTRTAHRSYGPDIDNLARNNRDRQATTITQRGFRGPKRDLISSSLDEFLSSPVIYFEGGWIERRDVIKYVANVAGGVHSGRHAHPIEIALQSARQLGSFKPINGEPSFTLNLGKILSYHPKPIDVDREGVDLVLIQLMAAARYLTISPDIIELEEIIRNEKID